MLFVFTKEYLLSGDEFYYQMDGATPCLPLGTVTVQETKAPEGYLINPEIFVQKITGDGKAETVFCYQAASVPEQVYRGDLEFVKVGDGIFFFFFHCIPDEGKLDQPCKRVCSSICMCPSLRKVF